MWHVAILMLFWVKNQKAPCHCPHLFVRMFGRRSSVLGIVTLHVVFVHWSSNMIQLKSYSFWLNLVWNQLCPRLLNLDLQACRPLKQKQVGGLTQTKYAKSIQQFGINTRKDSYRFINFSCPPLAKKHLTSPTALTAEAVLLGERCSKPTETSESLFTEKLKSCFLSQIPFITLLQLAFWLSCAAFRANIASCPNHSRLSVYLLQRHLRWHNTTSLQIVTGEVSAAAPVAIQQCSTPSEILAAKAAFSYCCTQSDSQA